MNPTLSDSFVLISLARSRHFPLVTILEVTLLFGKKIVLLTPLGVVMFQVFRNYSLLTPLEVVVFQILKIIPYSPP